MRLPQALERSALALPGVGWLRNLEKPLLILADVLALLVAYLAWRPAMVSELSALDLLAPASPFQIPERLLVFMVVATLAISIFWLRGHYSRRIPFWNEIRQILQYGLFVALLDTAVLFFAGFGAHRASTLLTWIVAPLLIVSLRTVVKIGLRQLGGWVRPALIIGHGRNAVDCARAVESEFLMGLRVSAFVAPENGPGKVPTQITYGEQQYPLLNTDAAMRWLAEDQNSSPQIFVALEMGQLQPNLALINRLSRETQNIYVVPAFRGLPLVGLETSHFFGRDMVVLWVPNNLARRGPRMIKRAFDVLVASALLVLLLPLLAMIALKVSRSGGSVLFGHDRIGYRRTNFKCYKFRTMVPNADKVLDDVLSASAQFRTEWQNDFKLKQDPRVTPFGAFLRRTSLDELPQLWNVLKGEMSLVGPRPIVEKELPRYGEQVDYYLEAKPGITGLWQISGRNDTDYSTRVQLDSWYVKNWSIWHDVVILLQTIRVVLARRGAY